MVQTVADRFRSMRGRTRQIFDLLEPEAFDRRPIPLRHPLRFYEGHLASFNRGQLLQGGFIVRDPEPQLTLLFARGIDPLSQDVAEALTISDWPERERVHDYIAQVDEEMESAIRSGEIDSLYLHTALEHEEMHQETLLYLIHHLPPEMKRRPAETPPGKTLPSAPAKRWLQVQGAEVRMGLERDGAVFGWDNEFPLTREEVAPFEIGLAKVSNGEFLEFVEAGGYRNPEFWSPDSWSFLHAEKITAPPFWEQQDGEWFYRGLFETLPLPLDWPVYVSHIEAVAYTRWRGCRLPSEAEWHAAAARIDAPDRTRDNFDFARWELAPTTTAGDAPAQLVGNGWEWTSTPFDGFPGFAPFAHYPGYSADFFDGRHFVLKGASPATPAALVRPSFRNWFQDQYRYAYTAFRCAR